MDRVSEGRETEESIELLLRLRSAKGDLAGVAGGVISTTDEFPEGLLHSIEIWMPEEYKSVSPRKRGKSSLSDLRPSGVGGSAKAGGGPGESVIVDPVFLPPAEEAGDPRRVGEVLIDTTEVF